jgi:hypothetical protein
MAEPVSSVNRQTLFRNTETEHRHVQNMAHQKESPLPHAVHSWEEGPCKAILGWSLVFLLNLHFAWLGPLHPSNSVVQALCRPLGTQETSTFANL